MTKTYHIFISHSWTYSNKYEGLISLLDKDVTFLYKDYSVPKDDPIHNAGTDQELYTAIKAQISKASAVIILAGVYATYSKWIRKEIEIARKGFIYPKPIIAVEYWGSEKTSAIVKENADKIVKWNSAAIIEAIKEIT